VVILFVDSEQLDHCAVDGTGGFDLPAIDSLVDTKIIQINLSSQQFKLTKTKQNKGFLSFSESVFQLLDSQFFKGVFGLFLDPFIHFLLAKTALINLPISTSNLSIDRE